MIVTTTPEIPGYKIITVKGIAVGLTVRSPTISQGFMSGFQKIFGGNIQAYIKMCAQAREDAYEKMCEHARALQANAVIGMRYETGDLDNANSSATEILCYGTAVWVESI